MNRRLAERFESEARRLAGLFAEVVRALEGLADLVREDVPAPEAGEIPELSPVPAPAPAEMPVPTPEGSPRPWDLILPVAVRLLERDPERVWRPGELSIAVRDSGEVELDHVKGLHFGLIPRLLSSGALERHGTGFRRARSTSAPDEPPPSSPAEDAGTRRPWDLILPVAVRLLERDPERVWRPGELSIAVRDSGEVELDHVKGLHLGLIPRLLSSGALERHGTGFRRARSTSAPDCPPPSAAAVALPPSPPGVTASLPSAVLEEIGPPPSPEETQALPIPANGDAPPPPAPPRYREPDDVDTLHEEIDTGWNYLPTLSRFQRTAQLCVWAGRARAFQEDLSSAGGSPSPERFHALDSVFSKLTALTRVTDSAWVDALSRDWSTDWDAYVAYNLALVAGRTPELPPDKERTYHRSILRGLFNPRRRVNADIAHSALLCALDVLPEDDPEVAKVLERFGRPTFLHAPQTHPRRERVRENGDEEVGRSWQIPPAVLERTRGRRALIAGGQGAREEHRLAIQRALELADLEWVFTERGQASPFNRLAEGMRPGKYDLVLFLSGYSSHKSAAFVRACKEANTPIIYLPRGYGVNTIVDTIEKQLVNHRN